MVSASVVSARFSPSCEKHACDKGQACCCWKPASLPRPCKPIKLKVDEAQLSMSHFRRIHKLYARDTIPDLEADSVAVLEAVAGVEPYTMGKQARPLIDEALLDKGAVLLRGLPTCPKACEAFVKGLGYTSMDFEPLGPKRPKVSKLDTATTIPGAQLVSLHSEMTYNPRPVTKIMLTCLKPSAVGGESLVARNADVTAALDPSIMHRFEAKGGVKYTRVYPSDEHITDNTFSSNNLFPLSWQERTGCKDKAGAEAFWAKLGVAVEWKEDDTMVAWNVQPAVVAHPISGERLWFNNVYLAPDLATYGNGEAIEEEVLDVVEQARLDAMRVVDLRAGEALMLDNYCWMHGRVPYEGSERTVLTVLTSD